MIDTHCHIDLYKNPKEILDICENKGIKVISMTNLPSHFEMGIPFFQSKKYVRMALGMHPLLATLHKNEFSKFELYLSNTSYIGEIGLDFSEEGISTKIIQLQSFERILNLISNKKKILSIHSRKAEKEVLELLLKYKIENAIFHWYSGPNKLIKDIVNAGYYFSINPIMTISKNGQSIISQIPLNKILIESDGPFVEFKNKIVNPWDANIVIIILQKHKELKKRLLKNKF